MVRGGLPMSDSKNIHQAGGKHLARTKVYEGPKTGNDSVEIMEDKLLDAEQNFDRQYRIKKIANFVVSLIIVVLGVSSVIFIFIHDSDGWLTFRWLTVDGTLFTTVLSVFFVVIDIIDFIHLTEHSTSFIYFARLAAAVAEGLIMIVVLISQLPIFSEHMHIFRYDMFNMHILIPVLMIASFVLNDPPIGKLRFLQKLNGTWYVSLYAAIVITLILTGVIPTEQIPYFFLDVTHLPLIDLITYFGLIFAIAITLSHCLSYLNRKLSWLWLRDLA